MSSAAEQAAPQRAPGAPRQVPLKRGALLMLGYTESGYWLALYWLSKDLDGPRIARSTGADRELIDALRKCFTETPFATEAPEVEKYLRATRWGERLP